MMNHVRMDGVERFIQLGAGYQSPKARGVSMVATADALRGEITPEKRFSFRASLCDSQKQLEEVVNAAFDISASAYGANLGTDGSATNSLDLNGHSSHYVMEIEFKEARHTLSSNFGNTILDPRIMEELSHLDTLEKWEEFYSLNGDQIINSVCYGKKFMIVISLVQKIRDDRLRRLIETKASFAQTNSANASIEAQFERNLKNISGEDISSVQILSIGDSNPDFLREVSKLSQLKEKVKDFVNGVSTSPGSQSGKSEQANQKKEAEEEENGETQMVDNMPSTDWHQSFSKGTIISYTTCSYRNFLSKNWSDIKNIEYSYDYLLRKTNRATLYLESIAACSSRINSYSRMINGFLSNQFRAFVTDNHLESSLSTFRQNLRKQTRILKEIAQDVLNRVACISQEVNNRKKNIAKANDYLQLLKNLPIQLTIKNGLTFEIQSTLNEYQRLTEQLNVDYSSDVSHLNLENRSTSLFQALTSFEECQKRALRDFQVLKSNIRIKLVTLLPLDTRELQGILKNINLLKTFLFSKTKFEAEEGQSQMFSSDECRFIAQELQMMNLIKSSKTSEQLNVFLEKLKEICKIIDNSIDEGVGLTTESLELIKKRFHQIVNPEQKLSHLLDLIAIVNEEVQFDLNTPESLLTYFSSTLYLLNRVNDFLTSEELQALHDQFLEIRQKCEVDMLNLIQETEELVIKCRWNQKEIKEIEALCKKIIVQAEDNKSEELWWQTSWEIIYNISNELDQMLSGSPINSSTTSANEIQAIDFRYQAIKVATLIAEKNTRINRNEFSGHTFESFSVPKDVYCLRFVISGQNLPSMRPTFNLESKKVKRIADHKSLQYILHENIHPLDPTPPIQTHMEKIARLIKSPVGKEDLIFAENESQIYKKIRINHCRFPNGPGICTEVRLHVFAQMGKEIEPLGLNPKAPQGKSDYSVGFGIMDSSGDWMRGGEMVEYPHEASFSSRKIMQSPSQHQVQSNQHFKKLISNNRPSQARTIERKDFQQKFF